MKIVNIEEGVDFHTTKEGNHYNSDYEGYIITLEDGEQVKVGIESGQGCCENYGYLTSSDNVKSFIGADFKNITLVETPLNLLTTEQLEKADVMEGSCMFVNIETSIGLLQLVCYNEHNGYYSHETVVISKGLNSSQTL